MVRVRWQIGNLELAIELQKIACEQFTTTQTMCILGVSAHSLPVHRSHLLLLSQHVLSRIQQVFCGRSTTAGSRALFWVARSTHTPSYSLPTITSEDVCLSVVRVLRQMAA